MMLALLQYLFFGVITMAAAEFQINFLVKNSLGNFFLALLMYVALGVVAYLVGKRYGGSHLAYYFFGGLFGIVIIEWLYWGLYPGSGSGAIQAAMFTNWAAVFTIPRIFDAETTAEVQQLRHKLLVTIAVYSVISTCIVFLLPIPLRSPSLAVMMGAYSMLLGFFLIPFLAQSARAAKLMRIFLWLLVIAAVANILLGW